MPELRLLTVDDSPAFVALRKLALKTDPDAFFYTSESDPNSKLDVVQERISSATEDCGPFIIGAFDPALVGVIGLVRPPTASLQIWGFYVARRSRGRGIGRALLARALEVARAMPDAGRLELAVSETSASAIRLYESAGFRDARTRSKPGTREMVLQTS
jgi:ribosomal protein S18 acetylase RimI-like enzyme